MEIDPSKADAELEALRKKSEALKTLSTGPISSSITKLSNSSRVLPSEKDFHFYYNFDEFRAPIDEIGAKSQSMLRQIGSSKRLWGGKELVFPQDVEDDSCDWLVNVNDEVTEKFDMSLDEFSRLRKLEEEEARNRPLVDANGFQLVCGKKKKAALANVTEKEDNVAASTTVRVAERDKKTAGPKPKIPFHIPTIRRPQEEFNILVNNKNQPYQHVWLERSEDGSRFIHPLEKLSVSDFVDSNVEGLEPVEPPPYESTPFKLVEDVKDLKEMAAKLRSVNELAVDLEHNQYRSFQGLTCLMQISTRTEDFVVDTLKLRIHIGPYLREIFKDPTKKKVMHGADRDIAWLQRDFGIYVCNLFDTGQVVEAFWLVPYSSLRFKCTGSIIFKTKEKGNEVDSLLLLVASEFDPVAILDVLPPLPSKPTTLPHPSPPPRPRPPPPPPPSSTSGHAPPLLPCHWRPISIPQLHHCQNRVRSGFNAGEAGAGRWTPTTRGRGVADGGAGMVVVKGIGGFGGGGRGCVLVGYAREDTHYLLYIYDLMRVRLFSECTDPDNPNALLLEVYKRSYDLCMQLYEKELLTDTSYLHIYGVQGANLDAKQLSVVAGLFEWRDGVARQEDESTGYILPNKLLLEIVFRELELVSMTELINKPCAIECSSVFVCPYCSFFTSKAKQMPLTTSNLKRLLKSKHPYVERSLSSVINIIRHSVQNASSFEAVAEQLKEGRIQVPQLVFAEDDFPELQTAGDISEANDGSLHEQPPFIQIDLVITGLHTNISVVKTGDSYKANGQNGNVGTERAIPRLQRDQSAISRQKSELATSTIYSGKVSEATVQVRKKPGGGFGALLGSSASKKTNNFNKGVFNLEQIKSTVNLPFYAFSHSKQEPNEVPKQAFEEQKRISSGTLLTGNRALENASSSKSEDIILLDGDQQSDEASEEPNTESEAPVSAASNTKFEDIINLDSDSNDDEELAGEENNISRTTEQFGSEPELVVLDDDDDDDDEPMSLSDLSTSFQKCLQAKSQDQVTEEDNNSKETGVLQFKPFDYEAARKQMEFGANTKTTADSGNNDFNVGKKKGVGSGRSKQDELLPQGKRRQAFPASGNRSSTFR
ncbi:hypothetical protein KSS87_003885 [Heliosperma pusillum]|nr:hypothetical protein KSS87_003885 [Heliosperma pusillum]